MAPKIFTFRVIELWVAKQPQEALAWASSISWPNMIGVDLLGVCIATLPHNASTGRGNACRFWRPEYLNRR
jgi:hypothetical protein